MGQKKIEIKKIENKRSLEVTFSKRRTGLFKKVDNLCTLCDAEAAVIIFSSARRPYVFGHPLVDSVIDRFLHEDTHSSSSVGHGQRQCLEAPESLQVKRERKEATRIGNREDGFWWDAPIENMGLFELEHFNASIEELRKKVTVLVEGKMMMEIVHCNAMVEYTTPPQSQLQFQFQPHDQDSSPLLDGLSELEHCKASIQEFREKVMVLVQEKTMMMESVPCNAMVEYVTPPQSQLQLQFQCQPHDHDFFPHFDGVLYGFVQCQPHDQDSSFLDGLPYGSGFDCGLGHDGIICGFGHDEVLF